MKKIVIAPDSFKESLSAKEVSDIIGDEFAKVFPNAEIVKIPLADGGEGTAAALKDSIADATWIAVATKDPLHRDMQAEYLYSKEKNLAIIEAAAASGLMLLQENERNPNITSSFGTGILIKHALDMGVMNFIIGLGGSATNDGGMGIFKALGAKFFDKDSQPLSEGGAALSELAKIDISEMDNRLKACNIVVACDVNNVLYGKQGASHVFGPQKGADINMVASLDKAIKNYCNIMIQDLNIDVSMRPGGGAAGGIGAAFMAFCPHADFKPGIDIMSEVTGLNQHMLNADLAITGEGRIDFQTLSGKTPMAVVNAAKANNVPVIAIAGTLGVDAEKLLDNGFMSIFDITSGPMSLAEALAKTEDNLKVLARSIALLKNC